MPARPPTPASVTVKEPGGDAVSPHRAALERLLSVGWGARNDKDDLVWAPTPDWENWRRVHYFGVEQFTGFRYGDDHHVMAIVFVQDVPEGTLVTSDSCIRRFEQWGLPQTRAFDVKFGPFEPRFAKWRGETLEMRRVDGHVNFGFTSADFSAAWAAYPAYPNACLIYAVAVPWRDSGDLAQKLRDRWLNEGFTQMQPRTTTRPVPTP
ncbi:MAG TPA: hypothetical protein VGM29_08040 [Polyangiaceae bacterium]